MDGWLLSIQCKTAQDQSDKQMGAKHRFKVPMPRTCSPVVRTRRVYAFASAADLRNSARPRLLHSPQSMRVLGIDCGGEYTGYGVVEQDEAGCLCHVCSGAIRLSARQA